MTHRWIALFTLLNFALPLVASDSEHPTKPQSCLKIGFLNNLQAYLPIAKTALTSVYQRVGMCFETHPMLPQRIENRLISGEFDGDYFRAQGYEKLNNLNLMPVPQPLFEVNYVFIWLKKTSFDGNPSHLERLTVGHFSGHRWLEANLDPTIIKTVPIPNNSPVPELLTRGRFDVFALDGLVLSRIITQNPKFMRQINHAVWKQVPFQHFLTKKHAGKIDALNTAAVSAIKSGGFDAVYALPGISRPEIEE